MKKILLFASIITCMSVFSQQSSTVNVTIKLNDVQTIVVNNNVNNVLLEYSTQSDYQNGVSSLQANHLSTFSTQDYFVKSNVTSENVITQNDVYLNGILQTITPQTLFTNSTGVHTYDVTYKAKGNLEYINKPKTSYVVQVLYSIEPQ